jgi:hypothetical protein
MKNKITDLQKLQKFLSTHIPLTSWDYEGFKTIAPEGLYDAQKDWNQTLITKINQTSATIFKATHTGGANVVLIPDTLKELFKTLEYLTLDMPNILHGTKNGRCQVYEEVKNRFGILGGRFQVYAIPELTKTSLTIPNSLNQPEIVNFDEDKVFVCKVKDTDKIFDIENYLKVGVVTIHRNVNLFE